MTDTNQPSPEELRAYVQQLREASPAEIVAQAYTILGTGAEVKLGRPDARALIDGMAALVDAVVAHLPAELTQQMRDGISQLQLAQVQVEQELAQRGEGAPAGAAPGGAGDAGGTAGAGAGQPGDTAAGGGPAGGGGAAGGAAPGSASRVTDRLWIPGRDNPQPRPNPPRR